MMRSNKRGVTLIALLVVVLIIGVLAAVALPQYRKAVTKSRLAEVAIRVKAMEEAIDLYVLENGYPVSGRVDLFDVYPDLTGGLTKTGDNGYGDAYYGSKYAWYELSCRTTSCSFTAYFSKSGNASATTPDNDNMSIYRSRNKSSGWGEGSCIYGAHDNKDGPALCGVFPNYRAVRD